MRAILEYAGSDKSDLFYGLMLVIALLTTELIHTFSFCTMFIVNHTTGNCI